MVSDSLVSDRMTDFLDFDERIRLAIKIGESQYREFKSGLEGPPGDKKPRDIRQVMTDVGRTLVAFANADGGELLIGVEDDGTLTGVPFPPDGVQSILNATNTHVYGDTPLPSPRKKAVSIDGHTVIYFAVSKGTQFVHLTSDGRCLKRLDRESVPFSAEKITALRLEDQSRSWDREPAAGLTLDDLDLDLINSVASQVAYGITVEKCLQYLDLAEFTHEGLRLKRAAAVLFAKDVRRWHPGCFVRIIVVSGKERRSGESFNVKKDEVVSDNVLQLAEVAWERLNHALSTHTQLTESARFQTALMYPQIACRETLMNAIIHRNYAVEGRGIEISIYQDRMEVLSPGMLLSTISLDDLRALKGVHESRNPLIARVLREVGLVREMGEGIPRIFDVMRSSALSEPDIQSDTGGFAVTLYHRSLYDPNVKLWLSTFEQYKLTEAQRAILALGYGGKEFSTQDIIDRLGIVDIDELQKTITPLRQDELIERTRTHQQAYQYAKQHRLPKREVPTYRVIAPSQVPRSEASEADEAEQLPNEHELFLCNLPYQASKEDILDWLSQECGVNGLELPDGRAYGSANRGFAFATVDYAGATAEVVAALDGRQLKGRPIHVKQNMSSRSSGQY